MNYIKYLFLFLSFSVIAQSNDCDSISWDEITYYRPANDLVYLKPKIEGEFLLPLRRIEAFSTTAKIFSNGDILITFLDTVDGFIGFAFRDLCINEDLEVVNMKYFSVQRTHNRNILLIDTSRYNSAPGDFVPLDYISRDITSSQFISDDSKYLFDSTTTLNPFFEVPHSVEFIIESRHP